MSTIQRTALRPIVVACIAFTVALLTAYTAYATSTKVKAPSKPGSLTWSVAGPDDSNVYTVNLAWTAGPVDDGHPTATGFIIRREVKVVATKKDGSKGKTTFSDSDDLKTVPPDQLTYADPVSVSNFVTSKGATVHALADPSSTVYLTYKVRATNEVDGKHADSAAVSTGEFKLKQGTGGGSENQAPYAPGNTDLNNPDKATKLTFGSATTTSITFSWSKSLDKNGDDDVAKYVIRREGPDNKGKPEDYAEVPSTGAATYTYTDDGKGVGLETSRHYIYSVFAVDKAGAQSKGARGDFSTKK